ncbi:STAS domain-containing protein [Rhodococcus sp. BP-349]|uniref:STAS domain-containing protein n=1 Tax=unclassified Rhodococcus (in: high G+C Gram-positive bacteria) TaxID=192944 RepID=UPI001C9ADF1D|nr:MULTISPECIES: STAS domain-containing protein [unclassified Rhodococcus (in: high G+C Gram-positive bacteria)]MBY6540513.1 STAS domain-containing protein [Rhodococcus sp. BP-363]MBY6545462.1 STAS domain-containing protein [Rhodococcus sp. BP-369]MBY6564692.1 STAS domain-containing protein [Rhodococcus sp. BP-370]MBY6578372.1 STAS domain-containing protein [Rhodococcus sp. BP-364]MBY6587673.1 STAS domain-containing protein [Rhodococcus sp. BP-358]
MTAHGLDTHLSFDAADLTVLEYERGDVAVVSVGGEIDMSTTPELREVLARVAARGHEDVVLDLSDVTFLGSAGAVLLLGAASSLSVRPMVLVATDPAVRRPLELLGVCSPITVCGSIFEAVSLVASARDGAGVLSDAG